MRKLSAKMYIKILLFLLASPLLVNGRPTHCERRNGDAEFRCGKDDYIEDSVRITNIAGANVSFKIDKRMTFCGSGNSAIIYSSAEYSLASGGVLNSSFSEVLKGVCNELFVYDCKKNNDAIDCLDAVVVYPNLTE